MLPSLLSALVWGLAAAILLAAAGVRVKVIERLKGVGGRTSAIAARGFKFDLGPTFFLFPRILEEIFATAGASLQSEVEMVRLDPHYRIILAGAASWMPRQRLRGWRPRLRT